MGRILHSKYGHSLVATNKHLIESVDGGEHWRNVSTLENRDLADRFFSGRLGCRVRRTGYHHAISLSNGMHRDPRYCIFAHNSIYELDEKGKLTWRASIRGGRPLFVCCANGYVFYGEYINNAERKPISVWAADTRDLSRWSPIHTFKAIRHVHGVFTDPFSSSIWITTGDYDEESVIWKTDDNFESIQYVIGGSQQTRTVQLLFDEKHIHFASDAPNEQNYIYVVDRKTVNVRQTVAVGGPVFYGSSVNGSHFFSTVVEPSIVNRSRYSEMWRLDSHQPKTENPSIKSNNEWYKFVQLKKDLLPMKIFQYGQIRFPNGPGDSENIYFTPRSTEYDDTTFKVNVEETTGQTISSSDLKGYKFC